MNKTEFKKALEEHDYDALKRIHKSDLHNHSMLGSRVEVLENYIGRKVIKPPARMERFDVFENYLDDVFKDLFPMEGFFHFMLKAAFRQAIDDGVEVLQMSIDSRFYHSFPDKERDMIGVIEQVRLETAPDIRFIAQLGMDRTHRFDLIEREVGALMETGYFEAIDLYGDELYGDNRRFVPLYKRAKEHQMKLCAHAGEYGSAESVRAVIDLLELEEVQHGIAVGDSQEVMHFIRANDIVLNVCPTSNVMLCRVEALDKHPVRKLFDKGIRVTVNTDDLMVFGQSVSDEYMNLFKAGIFSAEELDVIRNYGLGIGGK